MPKVLTIFKGDPTAESLAQIGQLIMDDGINEGVEEPEGLIWFYEEVDDTFLEDKEVSYNASKDKDYNFLVAALLVMPLVYKALAFSVSY